MNIWETAILETINFLGDGVKLRDIYEKIHDFKKLTKDDLRKTEWGGRPAYQHQVRSHITNLCQAGELIRASRAHYSLTKKGIKRIEGD